MDSINSEGLDLMDYIIGLASTTILSVLKDYSNASNLFHQFSNTFYAYKYNDILQFIQMIKADHHYSSHYENYKTNLQSHLETEHCHPKSASTLFLQ